MVLGSLILLFTVFIAVQYRYLFEGASLAGLVPGLTYAEYARRGFFELVVVAAFTLPLLLIADWLFVAPGRAARSIFRVMNLMLLCLVFLVLVSAFRRMSLYQQEYGLTELRFLRHRVHGLACDRPPLVLPHGSAREERSLFFRRACRYVCRAGVSPLDEPRRVHRPDEFVQDF